MIVIDSLRIQEFRGIRDMTLDLQGTSFVVFGPNGSGKSGVVDAIDFALTGNIARLTGTGSGGLTLSKHGPHVHRRDDPAAAIVTMKVRDVTSGDTATLTRRVRGPKTYQLEPETPSMRAAIDEAAMHPEIILSRREIIRYIVSEPGKRADEVQALLKLDRLGEIRGLLRSVQSNTSAALKTAESQVSTAEADLLRHLDLRRLTKTEALSILNAQRATLHLTPLADITPDTDLSAGVDTDTQLSSFNKSSAGRDATALQTMLAAPKAFRAAAESLDDVLATLEADPAIIDALRSRDLVAAGLNVLLDGRCPLCDTEWPDVGTLRVHLEAKLQRSEAAAALLATLQESAQALASEAATLRALATTVITVTEHLRAVDVGSQLRTWSATLAELEARLAPNPELPERAPRLDDDGLIIPPNLASLVAKLGELIDAQPDQTTAANARTFLIVAQERWRALTYARADRRRKGAARDTAAAVYTHYCTEQDHALTDLYETVEATFSQFYCELNSDDEASFRAQLQPSAGKLDLAVDFHGLGMFPPAAYHSEGHQDGMGVCLYLALVRRLLGAEFRLAVLDDVVMSIDTNHRRQFCALLRRHFPDVQFVITTHDTVWAEQIRSSGLVRRNAHARLLHWTVDDGPALEQGRDFWDEIEADLARDDVPSAAARLRRSLEAILAELADAIGGLVRYRADGAYLLDELLSAVKGRYRQLLGHAANAANTYNNETAKATIAELQARRGQAVLSQEGEQWAVNRAVHFNEWANFSRADFAPVVEAWMQFLALFSCSNDDCGSWIAVTGPPGNQSVHCACGTLNLVLKS